MFAQQSFKRAVSVRALLVTVASAMSATSVVSAQTIIGMSERYSARAFPQPTPAYHVVTGGIPCGEDQTEFITLGRLPEGLALLRMRSELKAAAALQALAATNASVRSGQPVLSMQQEVDSLARVVRSVVLAAPRRGETAESEMAQLRAVTLRVRALAPQVDQAVEYALARVARPASAAPSGYMGVTVSSVPVRQSLQDGYIVSYCEYPLIVAIDPGSPAERSGLQAGDTILAFNGQDVRNGMVDYTAMLTPNATVRVRAKRDGRVREYAVRVGSRPNPAPVRVFARSMTAPLAPAVPMTPTAPSTPSASGASQVFVFERRAPAVSRGANGELTWMADSVRVVMSARGEAGFPLTMSLPASAPTPAAPPGLMSLFTNSDDAMLFGAQLKSLGNDLRVALSLPEGVLVLQVLRGTPAADAELRDGDVIRAVDGRPVRTVTDIRNAFEIARGVRSLALRVARKNEAERTVVMSW